MYSNKSRKGPVVLTDLPADILLDVFFLLFKFFWEDSGPFSKRPTGVHRYMYLSRYLYSIATDVLDRHYLPVLASKVIPLLLWKADIWAKGIGGRISTVRPRILLHWGDEDTNSPFNFTPDPEDQRWHWLFSRMGQDTGFLSKENPRRIPGFIGKDGTRAALDLLASFGDIDIYGCGKYYNPILQRHVRHGLPYRPGEPARRSWGQDGGRIDSFRIIRFARICLSELRIRGNVFSNALYPFLREVGFNLKVIDLESLPPYTEDDGSLDSIDEACPRLKTLRYIFTCYNNGNLNYRALSNLDAIEISFFGFMHELKAGGVFDRAPQATSVRIFGDEARRAEYHKKLVSWGFFEEAGRRGFELSTSPNILILYITPQLSL